MARTFIYKAKDRAGQSLSGTILAENEAAVAAFIRDKGYFVTQIKAVRENASLVEWANSLIRVGLKDMAVFCRQFATMIDAGLPLISCLNVLLEQTYNPRLKKAVQGVYKKVQEGDTLARAMAGHPGVFPDMMVSMIEAGEVGGVLDEILGRLAVHFEKEHKMNEKVKSAMIYPAVVIGMAVMSVAFILTFVLPAFMQMFQNMKVELPLPTRFLLALSGFIGKYWPYIFLLAVICGAGLHSLLKRTRYKQAVDSLVLKLPIFGMLTRKIAIARFSRTLGTLVRGGVPIITALETVKKTTGNTGMIKSLTAAQDSIRQGLGLAVPLGTSSVFTPMAIQMIAVGEETGELDRMLEKIADFYESDVDDTVSRLSSMLEPVLIGVLGVVIGLIVISVVLPLFEVVTKFS